MPAKSTARDPKIADFDKLPDAARVRPSYVCELLAISPVTLYRRVREGFLPKPAKIGATASWSAGQLRAVLAKLGS